jgi:hypothetical protein
MKNHPTDNKNKDLTDVRYRRGVSRSTRMTIAHPEAQHDISSSPLQVSE